MAEEKKTNETERKKEEKGKKKRKNKPSSKKWKFYKISGDKVERGKYCPRCGPGVFLNKSNGRLYCGKCHLTEFCK